jgi:hypothetical protein
MQRLRKVLVSHALQEDPESIFQRISLFEEELQAELEAAAPEVRRRFDSGVGDVPNRIGDCRSFPL